MARTQSQRKSRRVNIIGSNPAPRRPLFNPMTDWTPPTPKESKNVYRQKVLFMLRKCQEGLGVRYKKIINHCRRDYEAFEEDTGFFFGEKVAIRIDNGDYLDNYILARVIGLSVDGDHLYLYTDLNGLNNGGCFLCLCYNPDTSLDDFLSMEDYRRLRTQLLKDDRATAPVNKRCRTLMQMLALSMKDRELYWQERGAKPDMHTMDSVPDSWRDGRSAPKVVEPYKGTGPAKIVVKGAKNVSIQVR